MDKKQHTARTSNRRFTRTMHAVSLIIVYLILASAALMNSGRLFGHRFAGHNEPSATPRPAPRGMVINTTDAGAGIEGYAGPVPLLIYVTDGRIDSVAALPNGETPGFFNRVVGGGLLESWNGMTVGQAADYTPDAISGATFSSKAVIGNVHAGLATVTADKSNDTAGAKTADKKDDTLPLKMIAAIVVALLAAVVPLFVHSRSYRLVQQLLNVGVLGFWAGTFVNYTMLMNVFENGLHLAAASVMTVLLLVVAFVYPIFGKYNYYCNWVCPLGSLQYLVGNLNKRHRLHMSPKLVKALTTFRNVLWCLLIFNLWGGLFTSWIDYELFTAFMVNTAPVGVLIAGAVVVVLSLFVPRPYCRFVCPTGTLMHKAVDFTTDN